MPGVIGSQQSGTIDLKAGESATFLQLIAPAYQDAILKSVVIAPPDYRIPGGGPSLANVTVTIETQKGGAFANGGLIPERVSGGDATQRLRARYRSVPREEPETVEVLKKVSGPLYSGKELIVEGLGDIKATPLAPVGIKVVADADVRIGYVVAEHEE